MTYSEVPPPWSPTSDEKRATDRAGFQDCETALQTFAYRANGTISHEAYTISRRWGNILRARVTFLARGATATSLITCWSADEGGVSVALTMDGPGL